MIHTALSATHMVDISLRDPGGGEMIKVRLQGTKEDLLIRFASPSSLVRLQQRKLIR